MIKKPFDGCLRDLSRRLCRIIIKYVEMTALIDSLSASENFKNTGTIMDFEEYGDTDVSESEPQRVVIDDVVPEVIGGRGERGKKYQ